MEMMMSQQEDSRPKSRGNREVSAAEDDEPVFRRGDRVYAQKNITSGFKAGKILTVHRNGLFDVVFDDDSEALDIPASSLRAMVTEERERERAVFTDEKVRSPKASSAAKRAASPQRTNNNNNNNVSNNARDRDLSAQRERDSEYYTSTDNNNNNNNNNIKNAISAINTGNTTEDSDDRIPFKVGDQVEARREGKDKFRFAVVAKVLADSRSCEVVYSDRCRETLPVEFIQFPFGGEMDRSTTVSNRANNNNTNNTNNNTRTSEESQKREAERKESDRDTQRDRERESPFRVGMSVEARFHGGRVYYPGKITALDTQRETATVEYSDGEVERDVPFSLILRPEEIAETDRSLAKSNAGNNNNINANNTNNDKKPAIRFPIGSRIEANYQNTGKWYPGVVADIREKDGEFIYSVDYNDGDKDDNMKESALREPKSRQRSAQPPAETQTQTSSHSHHSHSHHSHHHSHTRDQRSERDDVDRDRERGRDRESTADNAGGGVQRHRKFVDNNSDNESSTALSSSQYMASPSKPSPPSQPRPSTAVSQQGGGQRQSERERQGPVSMSKSMPASLSSPVRVEGNFQGKGRWFPARLLRERANGNVDLVYDDGDKEEDVPPQRVRALVAEASDVREVFQVGARVAANYRSGGVYYNGIVTRTKEDETTGFRYVDVLYDDGDVEKALPVERVRPLSEEDENAEKKKNEIKKASKNKRSDASESESEAMTTKELSVSTAAAQKAKNNSKSKNDDKKKNRKAEESAAESQAEEDEDELIASALLSQGALVEVFDEREKKWLLARVQSVSRGKANVKMISSGAVYEALPLRRLRLPRAATTGSKREPSLLRDASPRLSSSREKNAESAATALALSANDLTALRALLRSKDEEIERLRETVRSLRQQKAASPRVDESTSKKLKRRATDESSVTAEDRALLREELVTLHKANDDLKHSLAYLGDRFSLVVEELVAVKSRENKVAKQLQQQSEDIKRLSSLVKSFANY